MQSLGVDFTGSHLREDPWNKMHALVKRFKKNDNLEEDQVSPCMYSCSTTKGWVRCTTMPCQVGYDSAYLPRPLFSSNCTLPHCASIYMIPVIKCMASITLPGATFVKSFKPAAHKIFRLTLFLSQLGFAVLNWHVPRSLILATAVPGYICL